MDELSKLLKPSWGSEQWILEGWNQISNEEKLLIAQRMDKLFQNGLPFELKHDKLLYIYTFSLLAQLEVLAIQIPLKFESRMSTVEHRTRLHKQLLDEIFRKHGHKTRWDLVELTHKLPEWKNPQGSAIPIQYRDILKAGGKTDLEIAAVEDELEGVALMENILGAH